MAAPFSLTPPQYGGDNAFSQRGSLRAMSVGGGRWRAEELHAGGDADSPPKTIMSTLAYWREGGPQGALVLYGGKTSRAISDQLWCFDLATKAWRRLQPSGPAAPALWCHTANVIAGNRMVIYGGSTDDRVSSALYTLDLNLMQWQAPIFTAYGRESHQACLLNDMLYVFGGFPGVVVLRSLLLTRCDRHGHSS